MKVAFVGLGKLGRPCAEVMATQVQVSGYDLRSVEAAGVQVFDELRDAVRGADLVFVAVETPHDKDYDGSQPSSHLPCKDFSYEQVKSVLSQLNSCLESQQQVVLISTVLPGTVRRELKACLPEHTLIYNPYLIAMATVKHDFANPEMIIIGVEDVERDKPQVDRLIAFYRRFVNSDVRFEWGTWEEAESIKIFYNTFISAKLGLVNMIQDVAERTGHMNVDVVTQALSNSTIRIMSSRYMTAGLGDGGPCHPRDNIALRFLAQRLELGYDLFDAIMGAREIQAKNMAAFVAKFDHPVWILGRAYTRGVNGITDGSPSELVAHYLQEMGSDVEFFDPHTGDNSLEKNQGPLTYLIGYWDDFVETFPFQQGSVVVDPWRRFGERDGLSVVHYGDTRRRRT